MGCSGRVKAHEIRADQKWDFISLGDFKSGGFWAGFAYVYLLGSLLVSIAVYGVDIFTAVNLLAFDQWSGKIEPKVPLNVSKWIFSGCIIASLANLAYEYVRALRVIRRGAVAESYLDSLAVRLQCIRWTNSGRGWRRFLVFAELTKSKKGAEYVALFTYFSFQAWIRIIFCQGPRQVVNSLTLYAVLDSQLIPTQGGDVGSVLGQFFEKLGVLANEDKQQAVILSGMLFTLVIWVFGVLSLLLSLLFYLCFLWHYIPNGDGGLAGFCEKKINKRLAAIVSVKVNKAIEEEERKRNRADAKAIKKGEKPQFGRQATLPVLFNPPDNKDADKLPQMPMLNRNDTMSTLPAYTSRPGSPSGKPSIPAFELDQLERKRPAPGRTLTGTSFGSNAPLMSNASDMGYGPSQSPAPSLPLPMPRDRNGFPAPIRTMTAGSQNSQWSGSPHPGMPDDRGYTASPVSYDARPTLPLLQTGMGPQRSVDNYGRPIPRPNERSFTPSNPDSAMGRSTPFDERVDNYGRPIPRPNERSFTPVGPSPSMGRSTPFDESPQLPSLQMGHKQQYSVDEYGRPVHRPNERSFTPVGPSPSMGRSTPFDESPQLPSLHMGHKPQHSVDDYGEPIPRSNERSFTPVGPSPSMGRATPSNESSRNAPTAFAGEYGRNPAMPERGSASTSTSTSDVGRNSPAPSAMGRNPVPSNNGYQAFNPNLRSASATPQPLPPTSAPGPQQPRRNMTEPNRGPPQDYFNNSRPGTAQSGRQPPPNFSRVASPDSYNGEGGYAPGGFNQQQPYRR